MSESSPSGEAFHYHGSVAPLLWAFVALAGIELVVVHFLLSFWSRTAALILSVLTFASILWLILAIRGFRRLPVTVADGVVTLRTGTLRCHRVPVTAIAGFRDRWTGEELRARGVSNLALAAWPNVWIDLAEPVAGRRGPVRAIAHKLDDPTAFRAAIERARASARSRIDADPGLTI